MKTISVVVAFCFVGLCYCWLEVKPNGELEEHPEQELFHTNLLEGFNLLDCLTDYVPFGCTIQVYQHIKTQRKYIVRKAPTRNFFELPLNQEYNIYQAIGNNRYFLKWRKSIAHLDNESGETESYCLLFLEFSEGVALSRLVKHIFFYIYFRNLSLQMTLS